MREKGQSTQTGKKVLFVTRSKDRFWSIEELFRSVAEELRGEVDIETQAVPCKYAHLRSLLANTLWCASRKRFSLIHLTGDVHYAILGVWRCPVVLTIHDLRFFEEAHGLKRLLLWWLWLCLPCKRANLVTVISEFTKNRLLDFVSLPPEKVTVVPNCVSPLFTPRRKPWNYQEPRILQVGTTPNKNLERLVQACAGLEARLWVLGRLTESQRQLLSNLKVGFEEFRDLPREDVVLLYQQCDLLSFTSTYEGFGMPILEAQAVGRPVLTSDLSPMREVAGSGAYLVNPVDVESIRAGLRKLTQNQSLRERLVGEGFKNVAKYSAAAIARQYAAVYEQVLSRE